MATGDIPSPFKVPEQRELEVKLRRWFYSESIRLPYPEESVLARIKMIDSRMVAAEAWCVCHPLVRQDFPDADLPCIDAVWARVSMTANEAIREFVELADELRATPQLKALAARLG
jgi:hypothetical protein